MTMLLKNIYSFVTDLFFPNRCPICDKFIKWNELICEDCLEILSNYEVYECKICNKEICKCKGEDLHYDGAMSTLYYKEEVKNGIVAFKVKNGINFAEYYSFYIAKKLKDSGIASEIDGIICVPMHKEKTVERNYNQSEIFAKIVAKRLKIRYYNKVLIKKFNNVAQHTLSAEDRKIAVKDLFLVKNKNEILGKNILICDDVLTTGSTLSECAKVLKENGASKVYVATIARTEEF